MGTRTRGSRSSRDSRKHRGVEPSVQNEFSRPQEGRRTDQTWTELKDVNAAPSLEARRLLTDRSASLTDESIAREFGVQASCRGSL
jgi:hypothetical protein